MYKSETLLTNAIVSHLKSKGLRPTTEIPFLGRSLDLVYKAKNGKVIAIEIKRFPKHILQALDQAKYCLLGADEAYVCIPEYNITEKTLIKFKNTGVGLIFITESKKKLVLEYIIPIENNNLKRKIYNNWLLKSLNQNIASIYEC